MIGGFLVGLVLFRGQLRPLRWPRLALSQSTLYVLSRRSAVQLPRQAIRSIGADDRTVTLNLSTPMQAPDGAVADQVHLIPQTLTIARDALQSTLSAWLNDGDFRSRLPSDAEVQARLKMQSAPTT